MKRPLALLAVGLVLILGAYAAPATETLTPPAEVTLASTGAPAPAGPPIPGWTADQPTPVFLDAEQQAFFLRAHSVANFPVGCPTSGVDSYSLDGGDPLELRDHETAILDSDWTYLVAQGRYTRWEDFQAMPDGIFIPAYQGKLLWTENTDEGRLSIFTTDGGGQTYLLELEQDSNLEYGWADMPNTYELVSRSGDAMEFYLVRHYADLTMQPDRTDARPFNTERWSIHIECTADG